MPQNNCDPAPQPVDPSLGNQECPKCGAKMEPIETGVEGPPVQQLQLCPDCYLVTWSDQDGLHARQGVPVKPDSHGEISPPREAGWLAGEPEEC
jgi:hypothetical protein